MPTTINISSLSGIHQNSNLTTGGGTDDTAVIQAALNAGPFPLTLVQDGVSLITGLDISSNTTLQCNANCGFYLANSSNRAIIQNAHRSASVVTETNITLNGGYYNGNKSGQVGHQEASGNEMVGFQFYGIKNLVIQNLTVYNSSSWNIGIGNATNVTVDSCSVTANWNGIANSNSTDGVDIRGNCNNVTLSNLNITAGDDAIALNSIAYNTAVAGPYIDVGGNISNVKIFNITLNTSQGIRLFACSSNANYGISSVTIYNLQGTTQSYVVGIDRDLGDSAFLPGNLPGNVSNISIYNSFVSQVPLQSASGFFAPVVPYYVDNPVDKLDVRNIGIQTGTPQVNLPTTNGTITSLISNGVQLGPVSGISTVNLNPPITGLTFLQAFGIPSQNTTQSVNTYTNNNTLGSLLLVWAIVASSAGTQSSLSISDSAGNTWVPLINRILYSPGHSFALWACYSNTLGGAKDTVTITLGGTGLTILGWIGGMAEYSNQAAAPLDSVSGLDIESGTSTALSPVTTTKTNELVVVGGIKQGTVTVTSFPDFAARLNDANGGFLADMGVPGNSPTSPGATVSPGWSQTVAPLLAFSVAFFSATSGNANLIPNSGIPPAAPNTTVKTNAGPGTNTPVFYFGNTASVEVHIFPPVSDLVIPGEDPSIVGLSGVNSVGPGNASVYTRFPQITVAGTTVKFSNPA